MIFSPDRWNRAATDERERALLQSLEHGMSVRDMEKVLSDAEIVVVLMDEHDMTADRIAKTLLRIGWDAKRVFDALKTQAEGPEIWGALLLAGVSGKERRMVFGVDGEIGETPDAGKIFELGWMEDAEREDAERELRAKTRCLAMVTEVIEKVLARLAEEEGFSESEIVGARAYLERNLGLLD